MRSQFKYNRNLCNLKRGVDGDPQNSIQCTYKDYNNVDIKGEI